MEGPHPNRLRRSGRSSRADRVHPFILSQQRNAPAVSGITRRREGPLCIGGLWKRFY